MKIKPEHYDELKQAIERVQSEYPSHSLESYISAGLTPMRFRWDLLWTAIKLGYFQLGDGVGVPGCPLYAYLNDTHIDTALRRITGIN